MAVLSLAETKGCCYVAYDGVAGERYRFPGGAVWSVIQHWASSVTGFKAVSLAPDSGSDIFVVSFAGTDSLLDAVVDVVQATGGVPPQYPQAMMLAAGSPDGGISTASSSRTLARGWVGCILFVSPALPGQYDKSCSAGRGGFITGTIWK